MDLSTSELQTLAQQLRKPEGAYGQEVGKKMVEFNTPVIAFTIECLHLQPRDHVLEIGFGPGEGIAEAAFLAPEGYIAGIDHSAEMLAMAEERNHRAIMHEQVELTLGEARALPYDDESFDAVFSVNVLHFWKEPSVELAECLRVLKPGGRIAMYLSHPSTWLKGFAETGVFVARDAKQTERILLDTGFQNVESKEFAGTEAKGFVVMGRK
ncbi:hypothetical protein A2881_05705 [Candidatus Peribacteria bacterium RIFCSPHIGHO2_01_FULL_55_13]|nr:MAG: hypothetical protein A2881_05705 [Candidatus Peribacteria bacterium RIFCSPHIGHO2_01_FULL_55_13]OGJ65666.1 MAG: hypothetical protein A3F36_04335 [Candidatus Peribacteria bacterium RIFCSPHIGHO2_12_FULL_55_11]